MPEEKLPSRGRVVAASRDIAFVLLDPDDGRHAGAEVTAQGHAVCGDEVLVRDGRILELLPRRTVLARARRDLDEAAGTHVIAANVDVLAVCCALDRPPRPRFIERAAAIAHAGGLRLLVLLTKRDLATDEALAHHVEAAATAAATALTGTEVLALCAFDAEDVALLRSMLEPGETMALLGLSGAGKSTLTNALLGEACQEVAAVREDDQRGRHTTTMARLLPLPRGAFLVDTPGVRTLGLAVDEEDVDAGFPEIEALAVGCRFSDCAHDTEPGCAVHAAVVGGALDEARLRSWRKLRSEAAWARARDDPFARSERKRQARIRSVAGRKWSLEKRREGRGEGP
jgi:ribosome biogenesis GTPase / thiamine phosphate phosphatase